MIKYSVSEEYHFDFDSKEKNDYFEIRVRKYKYLPV